MTYCVMAAGTGEDFMQVKLAEMTLMTEMRMM